jgi:peroxiredoxin
MVEPGEKAPDFTLVGLDGRDHSLAEILSKGRAVLAFFKVTCPVCQLTFPFLDRLYQEGSAQFWAIAQDGARDTREFVSEFGITFPALLDEDSRAYPASNAYRISHVPSMFLVEPDGSVSWASNGFSRRELADLGERLGVETFTPEDRVPEWKAG